MKDSMQPQQNNRARFIMVWVLFLFSGACGLIYEVLWTRQLGLLFGNTVHSLSAVLTAFMGGLALGSYFAGRFCERLKKPFFVYGCLEFLIGIYCLILPWLLSGGSPLVPFYKSLYGEIGSTALAITRFVVSFILLLIPTTFMGATLPVLTHYLVSSKTVLGRTVGTLYAINSFGAVIGAVAAGFYMLPELGKTNSNLIAAVLNLVLGALAILFGLRAPPIEKTESAETAPEKSTENTTATVAAISPEAVRLAILTFGITGFAAMATQIGWTRAISLGTGSSSYAFSLIVAVFILGLSAGGSWGARLASRVADPVSYLGKVLIMTGLMNMIITMILGIGPILFYFLIAWTSQKGYNVLLATEAIGIALMIIGPTFLMGASMPLTMQIASRSSSGAGRTVGTVYAINTLGAILGSLLTGVFLLPVLQIQNTLKLMALLYAIPGFMLFWKSSGRNDRRSFATVSVMLLLTSLVFVLGGRWDPFVMSSGLYLLRDAKALKAAREFRFAEALPALTDNVTLKYSREGAESTVAVFEVAGNLSLRVGGKPDASSKGDMHTQVGLTMFPALLHDKGPENVLVIGLGSGVSAGAALAFDTVKRVDVVEMSPEVVEASSFFKQVNRLTYTDGPHPTLNTPKLELIVNDGRNHLLLTNRKYDVISSEPSNPWMAGIGNLFTIEAFTLAKQHLNPGGIMCQWIHAYSIETEHLQSIFKTFGEVFPNVQLWQTGSTDFLIIGSEQKITAPIIRLRQRLVTPSIQSWLAPIHTDTECEFLASFITRDGSLLSSLKNAPIHTDDNMLLEFNAPRALYERKRPFRVCVYTPYLDDVIVDDGLLPDKNADLLQALDLSVAAREHFRYTREGPGRADDHWEAAWRIAPYQFWAAQEHFLKQRRKAEEKAADKTAQKPDNANDVGDFAAAENAPENAPANKGKELLLRARTALEKRDFEQALKLVQEAKISCGSATECQEIELAAKADSGSRGDVLLELDRILSQLPGPESAPLWALRARLFYEKNDLDPALKSIRMATRYVPYDTNYLQREARILWAKNDWAESLFIWKLRAAVEPLNAEMRLDYAQALVSAAQSVYTKDSQLAFRLLCNARRATHEACALKPDWPNGWETQCRIVQEVLKNHTSTAGAGHRELGKRAYKKLLETLKGDVAKIPADLVPLGGL